MRVRRGPRRTGLRGRPVPRLRCPRADVEECSGAGFGSLVSLEPTLTSDLWNALAREARAVILVLKVRALRQPVHEVRGGRIRV
jgi:hypothetical protein